MARAHLGLGRVFRRAGERAWAEAHLRTAAALLSEMGIPVWLAQAEAKLTLA